MSNAGSALMGIGRAKGDDRAVNAARQAIDSPLLETSIEGAKGVLFNITGGRSMTMHEIDEAAKTITEAVAPDANIIFGAVLDEELEDELQITVVATGFEHELHHEREVVTGSAHHANSRHYEHDRATVHAHKAEPKAEAEPVYEGPAVLPLARPSLINETVQAEHDVEPEPEVLPLTKRTAEVVAPPRRFASISSIEPEDNEPEDEPIHHKAESLLSDEPAEESFIDFEEPRAAKPHHEEASEHRKHQPLADFADDDDLDVPAFIRRKVE